MFRARSEGSEAWFATAEELGPPPSHEAVQSNRMNPPGIPIFYAADQPETALLETAIAPGQFAVGEFKTLRDATLLDLTDIPLPSLFEPSTVNTKFLRHRALIFLRYIAAEISRPIERDKYVHIEYVPTQVVAEYLHSQPIMEPVKVDGIKYSSSARWCGTSYALFVTQDNLRESSRVALFQEIWLRLVDVSHRSVKLTVDDQPVRRPRTNLF